MRAIRGNRRIANSRQDPERRKGSIGQNIRNTEIQALISAIGAGVEADFDVTKFATTRSSCSQTLTWMAVTSGHCCSPSSFAR